MFRAAEFRRCVMERLGRRRQHTLPDRKAAGLDQPDHAEAETQMGLRIPRRDYSLRNPHLFDGRVFVGDANGVVYSLDAAPAAPTGPIPPPAGVRSRTSSRQTVRLLRRSSRQCLRARLATGALALEDARRRSSAGRDHWIAEARRGPLVRSRVRTRRIHRRHQSDAMNAARFAAA